MKFECTKSFHRAYSNCKKIDKAHNKGLEDEFADFSVFSAFHSKN